MLSHRGVRSLHVALVVLPLATASCVREELYDEAVYNMRAARAEADRAAAQLVTLNAEIARVATEATKLSQQLKAREAQLSDMTVARSNDQKRIDDLVALNDELSQRLKAVGKGVSALNDEKGALAKALADTRARLEELRRREAAAEARAAQFRDLEARFRKLVDAGQLKVVMRGGRMLLELRNDVLFDSGRSDLKDDGKRTLTEVAAVLKGMPERRFQIAGHTDNVQIKTARFPSNWELSTARAVAVVKLFASLGMDEKGLSAAGYGEFEPVASNDTPDGRAKNRRIEIAVVPNLEELMLPPPTARR
jgi:chemotaxis protein MotB